MTTYYLAINYSKHQIVFFTPVEWRDVDSAASCFGWNLSNDIIYIEGDDGSVFACSGEAQEIESKGNSYTSSKQSTDSRVKFECIYYDKDIGTMYA